MKPSTKDQVEGKFHEVKGKVKEKAGQAAGNPNVEADGQTENLAGKIQKKPARLKKSLRNKQDWAQRETSIF